MTQAKPKTDPIVTAAELMGEAAEAAQAAMLAGLKLEMEGLAAIVAHQGPRSETEQRAEEAETEQGFDNLPV